MGFLSDMLSSSAVTDEQKEAYAKMSDDELRAEQTKLQEEVKNPTLSNEDEIEIGASDAFGIGSKVGLIVGGIAGALGGSAISNRLHSTGKPGAKEVFKNISGKEKTEAEKIIKSAVDNNILREGVTLDKLKSRSKIAAITGAIVAGAGLAWLASRPEHQMAQRSALKENSKASQERHDFIQTILESRNPELAASNFQERLENERSQKAETQIG